jgi:hypothetical protein
VLAVGIVIAITWDQGITLRLTGGAFLIVFLVSSIALTAVAREKNYEETWFGSRAIAELTKAETWSFIMKLKPYDTRPEKEAENRFLDRLREVLKAQQNISSELAPHLHEGTQITPIMEQIRIEPFSKRKEFYIQNRIRDQMIWYSRKAEWNKIQVSRWLNITWILEILAVAFALIVTLAPNTEINPVGIVLAASAGVLCWLNSKSYNEAAQSYGLVSSELSILKERAERASTVDELSETVLDTENLINQEHRVWLGRVI